LYQGGAMIWETFTQSHFMSIVLGLFVLVLPPGEPLIPGRENETTVTKKKFNHRMLCFIVTLLNYLSPIFVQDSGSVLF
jgi:hypothetical protein